MSDEELEPSGDMASARERRRRARRDVSARKIEAVKRRYAARRSPVQHLADWLTRVAGGTRFLLFHIAWFAVWIPLNLGLLGIRPFDPFPFGLLTMVVSLEAIFLSIFVLMSQNREARIAELREEVTLEVDLRVEEEVTKTLQLVAGLYGRLGFSLGDDEELWEMLQPLDTHRIEHEIAQQIEQQREDDVGRGEAGGEP
ncbi:MAG TPA: DUF1003 domain-containing protein [Longimicrobiales bacterium]|nr:DUF1003 domain-containing protein [Longimicrobiales bacterium]